MMQDEDNHELRNRENLERTYRASFSPVSRTPRDLKSLDWAALAFAVVMALGPLTVYSIVGS